MWQGLVYVDHAVIFGLLSSAGVFGCVADMLVAIYKATGFHTLLKWVDDFFVIYTGKREKFPCLKYSW